MTRPSERELEQHIDELAMSGGDYPTLTLAELLNYETEPVDGARDVVRIVETDELRSTASDDAASLDDIMARR